MESFTFANQMKYRNKILIICSLFVGLQACSSDQSNVGDANPLESDLDSFSYCLGRDLVESTLLGYKGLKAVNLDALAQGVKEGLERDTLRDFGDREISRIILGYLDKVSIEAEEEFLKQSESIEGISVSKSGILYKKIEDGEGVKPNITDTVVIHWVGRFMDGEILENTYERGSPMMLPVTGSIEGWEEAFQMMEVGSKWRFIIPSKLAFGDKPNRQRIPPHSPLDFEIELIDIK